VISAPGPSARLEGRSRTVRGTCSGDALSTYRRVSDVVATAAHSAEVLEVAWDQRAEPDLPSVGDRFTADNRSGSLRWTSSAVVVEADPGRRFAFAVGPPDRPTALWTFELTDAAVPGARARTTVTYAVELGSGPSMFDTVRHLTRARYDAVVEQRLDALAASMTGLLAALARESEDDDARGATCRA
jgi:hypothetical protein